MASAWPPPRETRVAARRAVLHEAVGAEELDHRQGPGELWHLEQAPAVVLTDRRAKAPALDLDRRARALEEAHPEEGLLELDVELAHGVADDARGHDGVEVLAEGAVEVDVDRADARAVADVATLVVQGLAVVPLKEDVPEHPDAEPLAQAVDRSEGSPPRGPRGAPAGRRARPPSPARPGAARGPGRRDPGGRTRVARARAWRERGRRSSAFGSPARPGRTVRVCGNTAALSNPPVADRGRRARRLPHGPGGGSVRASTPALPRAWELPRAGSRSTGPTRDRARPARRTTVPLT